jgi:uncharacterized protein
MSDDVRAVVDTNVLISASLFEGSKPRQVINWLLDHGRLLLSDETSHEASEVLRRPQFNKYVQESDRLTFFHLLALAAQMITVNVKISDCRDPKDNKFLELAVSGTASHIISGDNDLLSLHPFRGIQIVTPHRFLDEIRKP